MKRVVKRQLRKDRPKGGKLIKTMINEPAVLGQFTIAVNVAIRPCALEDLPHLEWFGLFTPHREIIHSAFKRHERGENLMLVAEANHFPVGQVWIDLARKGAESIGVIWAMRVIPGLQNLGIGTHLLTAAEQVLRNRGYARAEVSVEKNNTGARRLYERQGYHMVNEAGEEYSYTTPDGVPTRVTLEKFVMHKELRRAETSEAIETDTIVPAPQEAA